MRHRLIAGVVTIAGLLGTAVPAHGAGQGIGRSVGRCRRQPEVDTAEADVGPSRSRGHLDERRHARRAHVAARRSLGRANTSPTRNSRSARTSAARRVISTTRERAPSAMKRDHETSATPLSSSILRTAGSRRSRRKHARAAPSLVPTAWVPSTPSRTSTTTTVASRAAWQVRGCRWSTVMARESYRRPTRSSSPTRWCTTRASSRSTAVRTSAAASSS